MRAFEPAVHMGENPAVGILCLQGDYEAHAALLRRLGAGWRPVKRPEQLAGLQGLLLPGGESTTMWHFLHEDGFESALRRFAAAGRALFGTCAGAILLAKEVRNPAGAGLGCLDITIERNAYGRQTESSVQQAVMADVSGMPAGPRSGLPVEAVLIRAPRIVRVGPGVQVRARLGADPVWVEAGPVMATTFHPELGRSSGPHQRFLELAGEVGRTDATGEAAG